MLLGFRPDIFVSQIMPLPFESKHSHDLINKQVRYSEDLNTRLVQHSEHGDLSDCQMVPYSNHHLAT